MTFLEDLKPHLMRYDKMWRPWGEAAGPKGSAK